jgi:hypothetical protein
MRKVNGGERVASGRASLRCARFSNPAPLSNLDFGRFIPPEKPGLFSGAAKGAVEFCSCFFAGCR